MIKIEISDGLNVTKYNEDDLIGIKNFKSENDISYLIKSFIKIIYKNKSIKIIILKNKK